MKLNDSDIFVIKTIATYTYFDKCEKEDVITKEMFNDSYEKFSEVQKAIISYFIAEETELIQKFTERLKKTPNQPVNRT